MRGQRDLGLVIADKVCEVLGLRLTSDGDVLPRAADTATTVPAEPEPAPKKPRGWRKGK
jgi:hypothetical protein